MRDDGDISPQEFDDKLSKLNQERQALETVRAALRASFERFERAETALWDLLK